MLATALTPKGFGSCVIAIVNAAPALKPSRTVSLMKLTSDESLSAHATTLNAAKIIATEALQGIPRVSSGINEELEAPLFADSGPATPASAPLPNSSGFFDMRFSMA